MVYSTCLLAQLIDYGKSNFFKCPLQIISNPNVETMFDLIMNDFDLLTSCRLCDVFSFNYNCSTLHYNN